MYDSDLVPEFIMEKYFHLFSLILRHSLCSTGMHTNKNNEVFTNENIMPTLF
jgi:hypothetical protein